MKLIEIKNSLAKLYYEPLDFPLVISDFLTIDDGNQKILAQVVSIESTSKEDTNCAILKFALDLDEANKHTTYSGYVPALDAIVSRTKTSIVQDIFSSTSNAINVGVLTNSSKIELDLSADILNKFLYVQADRQEEITNVLNTLVDYNLSEQNKTLIIKFHDIEVYTSDNTVVLGKDLKLPVNSATLNYIYENDLTGLTVEQKAIVQDILLEIDEYIKTLEDGFIPFNTLLEVVNSVYESDKSTGIILFRNKLLKYKELDIFASTVEEINALYDSLKTHSVTELDLSNHDKNWTKEALSFALQNIDENMYVIMQIDEDLAEEKHIDELYKNDNIKAIVASGYECTLASKIKSFAKNLILFKPESQQKAAASYNSFLMKLVPSEFIVSGETTYYTPLIVKELPVKITAKNIQKQTATVSEPVVSEENTTPSESIDSISNADELDYFNESHGLDEIDSLEDLPILNEDQQEDEESDTLQETEQEETSEIKNIFDESVEEEIARDVDKMFTANGPEPEELSEAEPDELIIPDDDSQDTGLDIQENQETDEPAQALMSDDDLDILEQLSDSDDLNYDSTQNEEDETYDNHQNTQQSFLQEEPSTDLSANEELIQEDDDMLEELEPLEDLEDSSSGILGAAQSISLDMPENKPSQNEILESLTENNSLPGVPIYHTQQPQTTAKSSDGMNITEGNIVYHEKYGRGVVEELFNYGKRTLCSIQFDNVGRRLLDPNLAELKQM